MTRLGLANLFRELTVEQQFVPQRGLPIWGLHWLVNEYAAHLPYSVRHHFLSLSFRDILAKAPVDYLGEPIVTALSEEGNWTLACTTAIIASKPRIQS
jgi:hypothetical protein